MSIGSAYSYSGVRETGSLGGEFSDTVDANDSSRSEERKSSTSSRGREAASARFRTSAIGALKNLSEVGPKKGMSTSDGGFLFCFLFLLLKNPFIVKEEKRKATVSRIRQEF